MPFLKSRKKVKGDVILCHDCSKYGYIVFDPGGYTLPPSWIMANVRFKSLYLCGDCAAKRRRQFLKQLK